VSTTSDPAAGAGLREIRHEYTLNLAPILAHLGASLIVSTYQAGKVVTVGVSGGDLILSYHNFEVAMGVAAGGDRIAVGSRAAVWFLRSAPELVPRVHAGGRHDGCFLTRSAHYTGEIQGHEMAWSGDALWVVNTTFSCLCTLDDRHSFVPRWRPPFISALAAEDRCHLSGLAMEGGRPRLVTAMSETDNRQGWRPGKATGGCLIDVPSGHTVVRGLAMPHSPRAFGGRFWVLESGHGRLGVVDMASGTVETVVELPGYTRGLAFAGQFAFVGLSRIRQTSSFGDMPIAGRRGGLKCGVAVVDLAGGRTIGLLEFRTGVEEIFDVQLLSGCTSPLLSGPHPHHDGVPPIWMVPLNAVD
jgi:uncharacterized protein (TIGR03032 family)